MKRCAALGLSLSLLLACAPSGGADDEEMERLDSSIVGGARETGRPEVYMLRSVYSTGKSGRCSSTLIASRTLLTAAHCVDLKLAKATSVTVTATNKTDGSAVPEAELLEVSDIRVHPLYDTGVRSPNDIALVLLKKAPPGPGLALWNSDDLAPRKGELMTVVGYGITAPSGGDSGVKRRVQLPLRELDPTHIFLGDLSSKGVCSGDSGGPSFMTFPDGTERVVGVHSFTTGNGCVDGADIRVDAHKAFIEKWLAEKEAPPCGKDGVCSTQACPVPDADCVPVDSTCSSAVQCQHRTCVSDPQSLAPYCSLPCDAQSACPAPLTCQEGSCRRPQKPVVPAGGPCVPDQVLCARGSVCAPEEEAFRCVAECTDSTECNEQRNERCVPAENGVRYCLTLSTPAAGAWRTRLTDEPQGCASTSAFPLEAGAWLLAAWAGLLRFSARPYRGKAARPS